MGRRFRAVASVGALLVAAACTKAATPQVGGGLRGGCIDVPLAVSPEKLQVLTDLARTFNGSKNARAAGKCVSVRVTKVSSGVAMASLADGWPDEQANGPRPVVWSPASSAWAAILNQRLSAKGQTAMAPPAKPFMLTPLVIAMPRPMAQALGWPNQPIGFTDILKLAQDPNGWGGHGHPEWGPFRLGKTNPNFSTSALSATIAQYYAATNKVRDLSLEDLDKPDVINFARGVESSVVHYGDITLTFLNNWYRNDARDTALTYVSAVAVEEKSVIDYNRGNPDGILDPGEKPRPPKLPLVAIYPKEGTLFSDNPFIVLDAPWVQARQKEAARAFEDYVRRPDAQRRVLQTGFRPGNPAVAVGAPIVAANGVDANQPQTTLQVPAPPVMTALLDKWAATRKPARVMLVVDVSGSMGDTADPSTGDTKLALAKQAAIAALHDFADRDEVGLRIFSTDIRSTEPKDYVDLVPIGPIASQRELIAQKIGNLAPTQGTPLYTVTQASFDDMRKNYAPDRINAVVLLTDGKNDDPRNENIDPLLRSLRSANEGQSSRPVRVFTIGYGRDADAGVLDRIAQATNAAAYSAKDPTTINTVLINVISNF
jgi:Ca-activated chloride channel family protein